MSEQRTKTVILGTGGMGRETLWTLRAHNTAGLGPAYRLEGFVTSDETAHGREILGAPVLGPESYLFGRPDLQVVCAIGDPRARYETCTRLAAEGISFVSVMHPSVAMAEDAVVGAGSIVGAHVTLTTGVRIGSHVIVNVNASVSHDSVVEDFATLAPGVHLPGYVTVGRGSELGVGSATLPRVRIGRGSVLGAGALLTRDLADCCIAVGVPAQVTGTLPETQWL